MDPMIKFKMTGGHQEGIELAYEANKTVAQYVEDLSELYDAPAQDFKLVFKGKILTWKDTAQKSKLMGGTVMVVLNNIKKQPKKTVTSKEQAIPGAGISTGLGASSPFGVGGYEMVNHPQYMSAISSAVDPDKMEDIMNDPQYQGMMQQLLQDPDTMRQLINQNPMLQSMIKQNPSMKMLLENPALMKMVFNKDMIKKTQEFMKNGGNPNDPQDIAEKMGIGAGTANKGGVPAMGQGFGGFGGFGGGGMGTGVNPSMFMGTNPSMNQANQSQSSVSQQNVLQAAIQKQFFTRVYDKQLKELEQYGFKDKEKNLKILRQTKGNIDEAMQKLCSQ